MARPGSTALRSAAPQQPRAARGRTGPVFLTRAALRGAELKLAVQLAKAKAGDITGGMWEELWPELVGGGAAAVNPARASRPVPDAYAGDGTAFSLKTVRLRPAGCRPEPEDWAGMEVEYVATRSCAPTLTGTKATPTACGRQLEDQYAAMLETHGHERLGVLGRLALDGPMAGYTAYLYWEEEMQPLSRLHWRRNDEGNLAGYARRPREGDGQLPVARWQARGSQLTLRSRIPDHFDVIVLDDDIVPSREEATAVLAAHIQDRLLAA